MKPFRIKDVDRRRRRRTPPFPKDCRRRIVANSGMRHFVLSFSQEPHPPPRVLLDQAPGTSAGRVVWRVRGYCRSGEDV